MYRVCLMSGRFIAKEFDELNKYSIDDILQLVHTGEIVVIVEDLEDLEKLDGLEELEVEVV